MRLTNVIAKSLESSLREWAGLKDGLVLDVVADEKLPRLSILIGTTPSDVMDLGTTMHRVTVDLPNITEEFNSMLLRAKSEILHDTIQPAWSEYDFAG